MTRSPVSTDIREIVINTLEEMARALAADFRFDHVACGWEDKRERQELSIVVVGNKYQVLLQYVVAPYSGPQPPLPSGDSAQPGDDEFLAYEVFAETDHLGCHEYARVALCNDDTTVLALLRGLRAEFAAREGEPLNVPEQPWGAMGAGQGGRSPARGRSGAG
jgi:hypothetical protein